MSDALSSELIETAARHLNPHVVGDRLFGDVAATLATDRGSVFSGVCIDTGSGTAEHSAIAAIVTAGERRHERHVPALSRIGRDGWDQFATEATLTARRRRGGVFVDPPDLARSCGTADGG